MTDDAGERVLPEHRVPCVLDYQRCDGATSVYAARMTGISENLIERRKSSLLMQALVESALEVPQQVLCPHHMLLSELLRVAREKLHRAGDVRPCAHREITRMAHETFHVPWFIGRLLAVSCARRRPCGAR